MPTYEYMCEKCKHQFETQQSIKEDPLLDCPTCKEKALKRLIGNTTFILKGSGWAADNYSSKSP